MRVRPGGVLLVCLLGACRPAPSNPSTVDGSALDDGSRPDGPQSDGGSTGRCGGWDPGLRTRRARSFFPESPSFASFCEGQCTDPKAGFYTLSGGEGELPQTCTITSGTTTPPTYSPTSHSTIPCPYRFAWITGASGENVATWSIDTLGLSADDVTTSPNFGMALQLNISTGAGVGGIEWTNLDQAVPIVEIDTIEFDYRAKVCAGPNGADSLRIAHLTTYLSFWNPTLKTGRNAADGSPELGIGGELVVDLDDLVVGTTTPPVAWKEMVRQWDLFHPATPDAWKLKNSIQMNGRREGLITESGLVIDDTIDCRVSLDGQPFTHVRLRADDLVAKAAAHFPFVDSLERPVAMFADASARLGSVLLVGSEHWGRMKTKVQLSGYRIRMKPTSKHGVSCDR